MPHPHNDILCCTLDIIVDENGTQVILPDECEMSYLAALHADIAQTASERLQDSTLDAEELTLNRTILNDAQAQYEFFANRLTYRHANILSATREVYTIPKPTLDDLQRLMESNKQGGVVDLWGVIDALLKRCTNVSAEHMADLDGQRRCALDIQIARFIFGHGTVLPRHPFIQAVLDERAQQEPSLACPH